MRTIAQIEEFLSESERAAPMREIRFPAESKADKLSPIILPNDVSHFDAIRLAKTLGRALGHSKVDLTFCGQVATLSTKSE